MADQQGDAAKKTKVRKNKTRRLTLDHVNMEKATNKGMRFFRRGSTQKSITDCDLADLPPVYFHCKSQAGKNPWNPKKVNQDRCIAHTGTSEDIGEGRFVFGTFDGHGQHGEYVSQYLIDNLVQKIASEKKFNDDVKKNLKKVCVGLEKDLEKSVKNKNFLMFSGSTGVICFLDQHKKKIWCANVGDSRAVMARETAEDGAFEVIELSQDQKPELPAERERIEKMGGRVEQIQHDDDDYYDDGFEEPYRVWLKHQDIPGLAMARSFGDLVVKKLGVIAEPVVEEFDHTIDDICIAAGSDGIWDFMSNEKVLKMALEKKKVCKGSDEAAQQACDEIVTTAVAQWEENEEVIDDCSAVVAFFK